MILADVNVLIYAFRRDSQRHKEFKRWLEGALSEETAFGYSEFILSAFIRIVTHPRIFTQPSSLKDAFAFADFISQQPNAVKVSPQTRYWEIFRELCAKSGAKGNLVPDAFFAALALESGSTWITVDRDFSRFPGLKFVHPLEV